MRLCRLRGKRCDGGDAGQETLSAGGRRWYRTVDLQEGTTLTTHIGIRVYPISEFRNSIRERLQEARESQDPVYIAHHGKPQAVVLDIDTYERLIREVYEFRHVATRLEELSQRL